MKRKQLILLEMMAGVLLFVIAAVVMVPKFLNSQNLNSPMVFPDENFRKQISFMLRKQPEERFNRAELLEIKELDLRYVNDLTGIRTFRNLERLTVTYRDLVTVQLPNLPSLVEFNCSSNKLIRIDVSRCKNLEVLNVSDNALAELIVPKLENLIELNCSNNVLKKLEISGAPKLEWLDCSNNLLVNLDTSSNQLLDSLYCSRNLLSELDLSKNPRLTKLTGWENPIVELDVSHNTLLQVFNMSRCGLIQMDFTHNQNLDAVVLTENNLEDVPNGLRNRKLRMLYLDMNRLTNEDWDDVLSFTVSVPTLEYYPQKTELSKHPEPGIVPGVRDDN